MLDNKRWVTTALFGLLISTGCKKPEPEGYRVVGYDAATRQWTIMRNGVFDGKYLRKRLIVVCYSYRWGNHESILAENACHLQVGKLIVPNAMPGKGKEQEFLDIYEMPDEMLSITEGRGDDRVLQLFKIITYEVLPDEK